MRRVPSRVGLLVAAGLLVAVTGGPALAQSGRIVGWGDNSFGQATPGAVASGWWHSLVAKGDGTVIAWGRNDFGQATVPAGLSGVTKLAAGLIHSLALKNDGTVVQWGSNTQPVPVGLSGVVAIGAGENISLALKSDGTVVQWGNNVQPAPTGLSNVVAVSTGGYHHLALKSDGTVVAWGMNNQGQTDVPAGLGGVIAVAAGEFHSLALKGDGTVVGWGRPIDSSDTGSQVPAGLAGVRAISAGYGFSLALKNDGTMVAWGYNYVGQSTVPSGLSGVVAVSAAWTHSLALKSDGTLVAWGDNAYGQTTVPAGLNTSVRDVVAASAGGFHSLALRGDGTVVAWGDNSSGQTNIPFGLSGVVALAGGGYHSLALKSDGTVASWGANDLGQATVPENLTGVVAVSTGYGHNLALLGDGTVVAWGWNAFGQTTVPADLSNVVAVTGGSAHSLALKGDGTVVAWGNNSYGQSTVPASLSGVTAVAAGGYHSVALKSDGTVVAWGMDSNGQATVPAGLSGVVAVAAGLSHNLALKDDGTVVAWGIPSYGYVPAGLSGVVAVAAGNGHNLALQQVQEVSYDDGTKDDQWWIAQAYKVGVMFTKDDLPYCSNRLQKARLYVDAGSTGQQLKMFFLDSSFTEVAPSIFTPGLQTGWNDIDVSSLGLVFDGDFLIAVQWVQPDGSGPNVFLGYDLSSPANLSHSYEYNLGKWGGTGWHSPPEPSAGYSGIWMIRAVVEEAGKCLLSVTKTGTGSGTVSSSPSGIACGNSCSAGFSQGDSVELTATPDKGMYFGGWSGACTGTGKCVVKMDSAKSVTATFMPVTMPVTFVLDLSSSAPQKDPVPLSWSPPGSNCPPIRCAAQWCGCGVFNSGTVVTVAVPPGTGLVFLGWDGACRGTSLTCDVTMEAYTWVSAMFGTAKYTLSVTKSGTGTGTVESNPGGISCGADCLEEFDANTVVTLRAKSEVGTTFSGWSGACTGTDVCVVTMDSAKSVTATLDRVIPVIQTPGDITAVSPSASNVVVTYSVSATDPVDGTVPVTCNPASGSYFVLGATSVNCTATNSSGNSASATFHVIVTTDAGGSGGGTVPSEGGTVQTQDGSVAIAVPAGAVPPGTYISIAETGTSYELTSNLGNGTAVFGVVIQPEGTQFATPVTITFSWDDANNDGVIDGTNIKEANVIITKDNVAVTGRCKDEPGPIESTGIMCSAADNYFKFQVTGLSVFALMFVDDLGPLSTNVTALPSPVPVNSAVTLSALVDDTSRGGTRIFSAEYSIDGSAYYLPMDALDGVFDTVQEQVVATLPAFSEPAVHVVCVRGWDAMRNEQGPDECIFLPVYDPTAGFVTGGGWIISPPGAYVPTPQLTGKATFGFVSKYLKGAKVPTGQTQFDFQVGDLNFHSSSYDWLVVAGARAQYKGTGTVNGVGPYKFILTAIDAEVNKNDSFTVDRFRIKIWTEGASGVQNVVYDNALGIDADAGTTPISGGSIIVHAK